MGTTQHHFLKSEPLKWFGHASTKFLFHSRTSVCPEYHKPGRLFTAIMPGSGSDLVRLSASIGDHPMPSFQQFLPGITHKKGGASFIPSSSSTKVTSFPGGPPGVYFSDIVRMFLGILGDVRIISVLFHKIYFSHFVCSFLLGNSSSQPEQTCIKVCIVCHLFLIHYCCLIVI